MPGSEPHVLPVTAAVLNFRSYIQLPMCTQTPGAGAGPCLLYRNTSKPKGMSVFHLPSFLTVTSHKAELANEAVSTKLKRSIFRIKHIPELDHVLTR